MIMPVGHPHTMIMRSKRLQSGLILLMIMELSEGAPDPAVTPTAATNGGDARRRTPHSPYAALAVRRTLGRQDRR